MIPAAQPVVNTPAARRAAEAIADAGITRAMLISEMSTRNGRLIAKIPVGSGPHGLCVFPQPGRYSLGHTGNFR
jgi:hypothetical protein